MLGSCQHHLGQPDLCKSLINYIASGHIQMACILDENDRIVSRAMLKMNLNQNGDRALFLERVYPEDTPSILKNVIINKAKAYAKALCCPLFGFGFGAPENYEGSISCDVFAGFEYCDALSGAKEDRYIINNPGVLYMPTPEQRFRFDIMASMVDEKRTPEMQAALESSHLLSRLEAKRRLSEFLEQQQKRQILEVTDRTQRLIH